jgi:acetyltransferase-like isoleucine patch superfamily enzyme
VIGAGSTVIGDIGEEQIAIGSPAKSRQSEVGSQLD